MERKRTLSTSRCSLSSVLISQELGGVRHCQRWRRSVLPTLSLILALQKPLGDVTVALFPILYSQSQLPVLYTIFKAKIFPVAVNLKKKKKLHAQGVK